MLSMGGRGRIGSSRKLGTRLLGVSACCAPEWQAATAVQLLSWHAYPLHCSNVQNFCVANYWKIWRKGKHQQTKWNLTATSVLSLIVNRTFNVTGATSPSQSVTTAMQQNNMIRKLVFLVWNYLVLLAEEAWPVVTGQAKKLSDITEQ